MNIAYCVFRLLSPRTCRCRARQAASRPAAAAWPPPSRWRTWRWWSATPTAARAAAGTGRGGCWWRRAPWRPSPSARCRRMTRRKPSKVCRPWPSEGCWRLAPWWRSKYRSVGGEGGGGHSLVGGLKIVKRDPRSVAFAGC